jgi:hypothetical protein
MNIDKVVKSFRVHPGEYPHTFFALDLGYAQDNSVLMAVTRHWVKTGEYDYAWRYPISRLRFTVEDIHKWPLRVYYMHVVEDTAEIIKDYSRQPFFLGQPDHRMTLIVDASGVGAPVAEMLERLELPCNFNRLIITSGDSASYYNSSYHVPRRALLAYLRIAIEKDLVKVPEGVKHAADLKRELQNLVIGRQTSHDDLAITLAMACYRATEMNFGPPGQPSKSCEWHKMKNIEDIL